MRIHNTEHRWEKDPSILVWGFGKKFGIRILPRHSDWALEEKKVLNTQEGAGGEFEDPEEEYVLLEGLNDIKLDPMLCSWGKVWHSPRPIQGES